MFKICKCDEEKFNKIKDQAITCVNMDFSGFSKGFRIHRGNSWFKVVYYENYSDDLESVRFPLHLLLFGALFKFKKKSYFGLTVTYPLKFWICSLAFLVFSIIPVHDFQLQGVFVWLAFNLLIAFLARKEYKRLTSFAEELLQEENQQRQKTEKGA